MDIIESLLTKFYNTLTADSTLKSSMGGSVTIQPNRAKPDTAMPYIVHRLDMTAREPYPARSGMYLIDIWSDSPNASEILSIRKRVIELLDELQFNTDEAKNCELHLQTDGFIPEDAENIWHYTVQFNLTFWRLSETIAILGR